jgi:hypothetical protein
LGFINKVKNQNIIQAALPPAMTIQDIAEATNGDPELTELRKRIIHGGKLPKELAAYQHK